MISLAVSCGVPLSPCNTVEDVELSFKKFEELADFQKYESQKRSIKNFLTRWPKQIKNLSKSDFDIDTD